MSLVGQNRKWPNLNSKSVLPSEADIGRLPAVVRFVPIPEVIPEVAVAVYSIKSLAPSAIDQRTLYEGNSVLRGRQTPRIEQPGRPADELLRHITLLPKP